MRWYSCQPRLWRRKKFAANSPRVAFLATTAGQDTLHVIGKTELAFGDYSVVRHQSQDRAELHTQGLSRLLQRPGLLVLQRLSPLQDTVRRHACRQIGSSASMPRYAEPPRVLTFFASICGSGFARGVRLFP